MVIEFLKSFFYTFNIFGLVFCFLIILSFFKNKRLKSCIAIAFSFFVAMQITSLYLVNEFVSYRFFIHFNSRDVFAMIPLFEYTFMLKILVFPFGTYIVLNYFSFPYFFKVCNLIHKRVLIRIFGLFFIVLSIAVMSIRKGLIIKTFELVKIIYAENSSSYEENALKLDLLKPLKVADIDVFAEDSKNIIILSLESFEKAYLSKKMSHLTPNLRNLKNNKNWSYFDMAENDGSNWTSGSLYTTLTGYPAFFNRNHNSIFQTLYKTKIVSIFDILNKLDYKKTFLTSETNFSGTDLMLNTFGVDEIVDYSVLGEKNQDKDLFEKAKHIVSENELKKQKYILYVSTLSTHNPNGIYDSRMERFVSPQESSIEFMASAVDFMIGDFLSFMEEKEFLKNTKIFIMPDHLKHGNAAMFAGTGERGLYVLTNVSQKDIDKTKYQNLYQLDLPKLILDVSKVNHNYTFLSEQILGDKNEYVKNNLTDLTNLNVSGFLSNSLHLNETPKLNKDFQKIKKDTMRYIAHAGGMIDAITYTNSLEALNRSYELGFRLFELDFRLTSDNKIVAVHEWKEWSSFTNFDQNTPATHKQFMDLKILNKYSPVDMKVVNKWFLEHEDAILVTDKINTPKIFSNAFACKDRLMMELFSWSAIQEAMDNDIIPIVSENILRLIPINRGETLKGYGIEYVAMSRSSIDNHKDVFIDLKKNGIKVFAYHINNNIYKNEEFAMKYETDFYYGIYANEWSFE